MTKPKKELYECMKQNYDNMRNVVEKCKAKGKKPGIFYSLMMGFKNAYEILKKEYDNNDEETIYYITEEKAQMYNKKNEWQEVFCLVLRTINYNFSHEKLEYLNKLYFYIMDNKISLPISYYTAIYMDGLNASYEEFKELIDKLLKELKKEIKTK